MSNTEEATAKREVAEIINDIRYYANSAEAFAKLICRQFDVVKAGSKLVVDYDATKIKSSMVQLTTMASNLKGALEELQQHGI